VLKSFYRIGRWAQCRFSAAVYHQVKPLPIEKDCASRDGF